MNHTPPCDPAFLHLIMYPFNHCPRTPLGVLLMATPFLGPLLSKSLSDLIMIYQQDALFKAVFSQVKTTVITPFISPYHRCRYTTVIITVITSFVSPLSYHLDLITTVLQSLPYHHTVISLLSSHSLVTSSQYILSIHPLNIPLELPPSHGPHVQIITTLYPSLYALYFRSIGTAKDTIFQTTVQVHTVSP